MTAEEYVQTALLNKCKTDRYFTKTELEIHLELFATEQIKKDRERIAESVQAFLGVNDEPIVEKGSILNQPITLD